MNRRFATRATSLCIALLVFCVVAMRGLPGSADPSPITVNAAFSPNTIALGGTSTLTITLQNSSTTSSATISAFSDDLATMSGHAQFALIPNLSTTCAGGTPSIVGTALTMSGGTIPIAPNSFTPGSCTVSVDLTGTIVGNGLDTIHAGDVVTSLGSPSADVIQTLTIQADDLAVSAGTAQRVGISTTATIAFTVHNPATLAVTNASFGIDTNASDPYTVSAADTTCGATASDVPFTGTSGTVSFSGGTIVASGDCVVHVYLTTATLNDQVSLSLATHAITTDQLATNSGGATTDVLFVNPHPVVAKVFEPDTIAPGDTTTLAFEVQNQLDPQALTNASFSDTLPTGLTVVSAAQAAGPANCGSPTLGGVGTGTFTFSGGTIAPYGDGSVYCVVNVVVKADSGMSAGTVTNTVYAASFASDQVTDAQFDWNADLTITAPGGTVTISKSILPFQNPPLTPFETILRFNSVGGAFSAGSFVDHLPTSPAIALVVDGSHPITSTNCGSPAFVGATGDTSISASGISIALNATCTVEFYSEFTTIVPTTTTTYNELYGSDVAFTGSAGAVAFVSTDLLAIAAVQELPALSVQNYVASAQTLVNQQARVQGKIVDTTGIADTNVKVTVGLNAGGSHNVELAPSPNFVFGSGCPAGLSGANVTPLAGGESFQINVGALSATCTFDYSVTDEAGANGTFLAGDLIYNSTLTGGVDESYPGTNSVTFATTNINLTKAFTPNQIQAGETSTADITLSVDSVAGFAQTEADGVGFADNLPSGMTFATNPNVAFSAGCQAPGQPAPGSAIAGSGITFSNLSLLTVGSTPTNCDVRFDVTASAVGAPTNTIPASAVTSTSGTKNASGTSASLTVTAGLGVLKTFTSPTMFIGGTDYVRLLLTNSVSTSDLTSGTLTDTLPSALQVASTTLGPILGGDPSACAGASMTSGSVGSGSFTLGNFTIPAEVGATSGQCVLYVQVTSAGGALAGLATNTIPIGAVSAGGYSNGTPTSANVVLTSAPNPTVSKAFSPTTILENAVSTLTVTIANTASGAIALSNAGLSDALPSGLTIATTPAAATTCSGGAVTATAGAASLALSGASLAAGATCTFSAAVTASTPGLYHNSILPSYLTDDQSLGNLTAAFANLTVAPPLTVSKAFAPASIAMNGTSTLTVTVNNATSGAVALGSLALTDTLPSGVTIATVPSASTTCSGASVTATTGGGSIALSGGSLAAGATCTFQADVTAAAANVYTNTIPASAVSTDVGVTNTAPATAQLTVSNPATVTIAKAFSPSTIPTTGSSTLTITFTNTSPTAVTLTNANLTDTLPAGVVVASSPLSTNTCTPGGSTQAGPLVSLVNATIPANGSCSISTTVTSATAGAYLNTIPASALADDQSITNPGPASATLTVAPPLAVSKAFSPAAILPGGISTLTVTVANTASGAVALSALALTDALPSGVTIAGTPNATTTCAGAALAGTAGGTTIGLSGGSLAAGATCTFSADVTATVPAVYDNVIPSGVAATTQGVSNTAPASATLTVSTAPGLTLTKAFVPATIVLGATSRLTVTLANTAVGAVALSNLAVTDALPSGLLVAPTPNAATSCAAGTATANAGGTSVALSGGALASGATCALAVDVVGPSGGYTNTIPGGSVTDTQGSTNPAPATAGLTIASPVAIAKTFSPTAIVAGGTTQVTVTIANTGGSAIALSGVGLIDALPSDLFVASTPSAATTCGGTVSATAGGSTIGLSGGTLAAGATCTFSANATGTAPGGYDDVIGADAVTTAQGVTNAGPGTAHLTIASASAVSLAKSFAPSTSAPNGISTLTILVANTSSNAVALSSVALSDALPSGMTIASTPNASTTCGAGAVSAVAGATSVALTNGSINAGATCTIAVSVTGSTPGAYVNTIPAGNVTSLQGATNTGPATATLTIGAPSLTVTKTANPSGSNVAVGQTITYTVTVANGGSAAETNATVTDTLAAATLVSGSVTVNGAAAADSIVTAHAPFGTIAVGATTTIVYRATVDNVAVGTDVRNAATAGGDQPCSGAQCTAASPVNVVAAPNLTLTKTIDGQSAITAVPGQVVTYAMTVTNTGGTAAVDAVVTDPIPGGVTPVSGTVTVDGALSPDATVVGQTVTAPLGTLAAGASTLVTFKAVVGSAQAQLIANVAQVSASGLAAAFFSNTVTVQAVPATISVTKSASATTVTAGDRVNYTIAVEQTQGIAFGATTVVDTLPSYEIYAPGTGRVGGRTIEPTIAGQRLTWTVPSLAQASSITYAVAIGNGVPAGSSLINTVSVAAIAPAGGTPGRGTATATVLAIGSTFGSCYPITGRVYYDVRDSGRFDDGDAGIGGVTILLEDGESVVTDPQGRYSFPCVRPGMHALRLNEATLPEDARLFDDRNIDSERSLRRLVHRTFDDTIIEDINFAIKPPA
jgi:uncharacterized repeat protein (TIGR01451 family)